MSMLVNDREFEDAVMAHAEQLQSPAALLQLALDAFAHAKRHATDGEQVYLLFAHEVVCLRPYKTVPVYERRSTQIWPIGTFNGRTYFASKGARLVQRYTADTGTTYDAVDIDSVGFTLNGMSEQDLRDIAEAIDPIVKGL